MLFSLSAFPPKLHCLLILFSLFLNGLSVEGGQEVENTREREMEREGEFMAKYRAGLNNLVWPAATSQSQPIPPIETRERERQVARESDWEKTERAREKLLCWYWQSLDTVINYLRRYTGLKALKHSLSNVKNRETEVSIKEKLERNKISKQLNLMRHSRAM